MALDSTCQRCIESIFEQVRNETLSKCFAGDFPVVEATYQIERAGFNNQKIAICATEKAMFKYMEAHWADNKATMRKMLYKIETMDDVDRMSNARKSLRENRVYFDTQEEAVRAGYRKAKR